MSPSAGDGLRVAPQYEAAPSLRLDEVVGEDSHPHWIIPIRSNLPIDVACGAPRALVAICSPRPCVATARYNIPTLALAVCEGMSGGPSILVIDADESFHRILSVALRGKGCTCDPATRQEDAARKLERGAYEVVVVNLDVPGCSDLLQVRRHREWRVLVQESPPT